MYPIAHPMLGGLSGSIRRHQLAHKGKTMSETYRDLNDYEYVQRQWGDA